MRILNAIAVCALLTGCASSTSYVNLQTGQRISGADRQNPDLAACQAEYQRAFAQSPQLWMGEIVPMCMKARGWQQE